ncbi:unnamed protein product [Moneuplotes crassus]|uniref:BZIP domain-containing protein n=1 Tax=Euplotes crassus TaxID=5936 RepID=A0AAD1UHA1_EUPCR|nr:unnamed protein product [Moneuplotes crassus]
MEDHQYIVTTSMFQYLEEIDNVLRENTAKQTQENLLEMGLEDQMMSPDPLPAFNQEFIPDQSYEFDFGPPNEIDNDMFSQKLDLNEDIQPDDEIMPFSNLKPTSSTSKLNLSVPKTTLKEPPQPTESEIKEPEPKNKPRMSNKERARKARQRKKKYYEDLEKRCGYLEDLCKNLTKELQYAKHKIRLFECTERGGTRDELNRDIRMIDNLIERAKKMDGKDEKLMKTIRKIQLGYSSMGAEKMKILDGSFDLFLENILCGTDFQSMFYAADKKMPSTFSEAQAYLRMKKFEKYEQYPDEKLRDFLDIKLPMISSEVEYDHMVHNKIPSILEIKNEIKDGIYYLHKGKEIIYKALMKNDTFSNTYSCFTMDKIQWLNYLEEMKHSNLKFTYKDAFDVKFEEIDVNMCYKIYKPEIWSALALSSVLNHPELASKIEWNSQYKMNHLISPIPCE